MSKPKSYRVELRTSRGRLVVVVDIPNKQNPKVVLWGGKVYLSDGKGRIEREEHTTEGHVCWFIDVFVEARTYDANPR